jgi:transposase
MPSTARPFTATVVCEPDVTLFAALELSLSRWVVVASAPGESKVSRHTLPACDGPALLALLDGLRRQAERRSSRAVTVVTIQEAGRDGFWLHRLLEAHGARSHVVDPASIAVSRRSRRAKTDRIDAEGLLRALMAFARGERQVCSMVRPPTREAEDARRLTREREALLAERVRHTNRIKGGVAGRFRRSAGPLERPRRAAGDPGRDLRRFRPAWPDGMAGPGVFGFEPSWQARRARLEELRTPQGQALPPRLKAEVLRQIERLELVLRQIAEVEAARDAALAAERQTAPVVETGIGAETTMAPAAVPANEGAGPSAGLPRATARGTFASSARLMRLKGVGPETASVLRLEAFHRTFGNRREVAAYAGLTPTPWQSGGLDNEQGISKAGCVEPWCSWPGSGCATSRRAR